ncbi:hypothetical protein GOP47_0020813 [Adiantum capillus-veneris]|uniref:Uncharacterized protein n=1 Tax=Adiantum capillus-veneris TaxID=13818 RepID=A0A9D4UAT8_ADICA|nr:hypothetical protein GOP47_0020813 [Adiantum capillus-veneris]
MDPWWLRKACNGEWNVTIESLSLSPQRQLDLWSIACLLDLLTTHCPLASQISLYIDLTAVSMRDPLCFRHSEHGDFLLLGSSFEGLKEDSSHQSTN